MQFFFRAVFFLVLSAFAVLVHAEEKKKKEFPLVWLCLGLTIPCAVIVLYIGYRRPATLELPGMTVMQATSGDGLSFEEKELQDSSESRV